MDEIDIFIDEDDPVATDLLVKYNKVVWIGVSSNQTTIIAYEHISKWRRWLVGLILGVVWNETPDQMV